MEKFEDISVVPVPKRECVFLNNLRIKEKASKRVSVPKDLMCRLKEHYAYMFGIECV